MKPDYTEFDNALLIAITLGFNTMMALDSKSSGLRALAEPFARVSNNPTSRIIDRRLQALRKKGSIWFNGKVWVRMYAPRSAA